MFRIKIIEWANVAASDMLLFKMTVLWDIKFLLKKKKLNTVLDMKADFIKYFLQKCFHRILSNEQVH